MAMSAGRFRAETVLEDGELGVVTEHLCRRTGAEAALIARRNDGGRQIETVASWGVETDHEDRSLDLGQGIVGRVLDLRRTRAEALGDAPDPGLGVATSGAHVTHAVGAPLRTPAGRPAALCAAFSAVSPDHPHDVLAVVESYARLASFCLTDPGVLEGVLESSRLDGLTGCLNYASACRELNREVARSARHGLELSCCFIDLDGFGEVNDRRGHLRANAVLVETASALSTCMRRSDTLGRYGGDEFIAILPETGEAAACSLAGRLRAAVLGASLTETDGTMDASVGVAEWHPGSSAEQVLEAADQALRAAKQAGGGRVAAESHLVPT